MAETALDDWVDDVEDYWRRHDLSARDRRRLVAELEADLADAVAGGASVGELVGRDVAAFAREVAEAEGLALRPEVELVPPTYDDLARTTTLGTVAGAAAAWIWLTSSFLIIPAVPEVAAIVLIYLIAAGVLVLGAVVAVRWRYRWWEGARRASLLAGVAAVIGIVASIAPLAGLAVLLGYSTALLSLVIFAGLGAGICFVVSRLVFTKFANPVDQRPVPSPVPGG